MSHFEPVAIVGQGCVLPGASSPSELTRLVMDGGISYGPVSPSELGLRGKAANGRAFVSGRIRNFEEGIDPARARLKSVSPDELDPVCSWPLKAALDAWDDAQRPKVRKSALGVFVANLSYPSSGHVQYASQVWRHRETPSAHLALNSSLPSKLIAESLRSTGPCLSLDAACASSLYAIDIASRKLATRQIDCAIVAAVNAADNLILHIGFDALNALSPTGRSRPFVKGADGLVPSEGAAALVLKRLSDVDDVEKVYGVIRGSGLSNDGRRKGLLAPAAEGQTSAMHRALQESDLSPKTIQYLECHATGTSVGDGVEISSAKAVYGNTEHLCIGSLKANTGHLITVAGLASVLKLTGAMEEERLPPTPVDGQLLDQIGLCGFEVSTSAVDWKRGNTPRRAAISNFGFGGNNAHLILEEYRSATRKSRSRPLKPAPGPDIVICAASLMSGTDSSTEAVLRRLMNQPVKPSPSLSEIGTNASDARTPPKDLTQAEPQQLAILSTVSEALSKLSPVDGETTGIFAGMACAADSARWALRERAKANPEQVADDIAPALDAAAVLGAMANMTANRITFARDIRGMGFSVSAGPASGFAALDLAIDALSSGRLSTAVVAVADFASEPVRASALQDFQGGHRPGDAAAALVLRRREDAETAGDPILATVNPVEWKNTKSRTSSNLFRSVYGYAPNAEPLIAIALDCLLNAYSHKLAPDGAIPKLSSSRKKQQSSAFPPDWITLEPLFLLSFPHRR